MSGNWKLCFLLVALLLTFSIPGHLRARPAGLMQPSSQVDPFYLKMLDRAEKDLARWDYERALRNLEIAAFGLAQDKSLLAKAYVYLGICHYHFKNITRSEECLRQAAELLGEEFASIGVLDTVRPELDKLLALYNIRLAGKAGTIEASGGDTAQSAQEKSAENKAKPRVKKKTTPPMVVSEREDQRETKKVSEKKPHQEEPFSLDRIKEGDIVPLDLVETRPVPVEQIAPIYPSSLRERGYEGTVIVNALVSEKGRVIKTKIIRGIRGAFELDAAAQRAVRQWEFEPATVKGIKVKVWVLVAIEFRKSE